MIRHTRSLILGWLLVWPLAAAGQPATAPRTLDGVAIDPDAELVVALADDTTNMDPRIGMGSIRSNYIRQVFEGLSTWTRRAVPCRAWPSRGSP